MGQTLGLDGEERKYDNGETDMIPFLGWSK
jgi:hypothetical protein